MADYYDTASQGIDQGKAALLAAIASQGSQAHQALQSGQDQIAAMKQQAIQQALAGARQRGAPQAELDQLTQQVGSPYDSQLSSLAASTATRGAGFDQTAASAGSYMDQAKSALPALRTQLAQKVAALQADAQSRAMQFQQDQALKGIELQIAQANLAKAQADSTPGGDLSKTINHLGGADVAGSMFADALRQGVPDAVGEHGGQFSLPDALGQQTGVPGTVVSHLADLYNQRQSSADAQASQNANSPDSIRMKSEYGQAVADFLSGASRIGQPPPKGAPKGAKPLSQSDVFDELVKAYGPDVARQVISDYGRALPPQPTPLGP